MYAKVIVDIAHANVDRVYDYTVPPEMNLRVGMRVEVPFGAQAVEGIVIGLAEKTELPDARLKAVCGPLEDFCALTEEQIALAGYIRAQYHTTLAQALRLMIPAQIRGGRVSAKHRNYTQLAVFGQALLAARQTLLKKDGTPRFPKQIEIIDRLKTGGKAILTAELNASAVKSLEKKGFVQTMPMEVERQPFLADVPLADDFVLTEKQSEVLACIRTSPKRRFLLHGVTGSGKTEIYIRVIRDCLKNGKTAILLVPEISLTPQTYLFLKRRFAEEIAVFHSGLSAGERYDEWMKVKRGQAKIVLGARSAVFAPLEHIGAIIVDEQHESSYKADNYPKYTAQEIAEKRCELAGAVLILGSATPDIATYYAAQQGEYELLKMPERLFSLPMPQVDIVDMRAELQRGNRSVVSGELYRELETTLAQGKQAMLFLNRRGYSTFVMCRSCGYTVMCGACDVTMTYHKAQDVLKCHYCGRTLPVSKMCPQCGKPHLKYFGTGTQQIEEQIRAMFPAARVLRMDLDTMGNKDAHLRAFEEFSQKKADILIGTQMITKGFDFEDVRVSAVLAADTMLNFPDYRSAERAFCQITQIAGRAGRKQRGRVILQTYHPEHYAVRYASSHDYEGFYRHEIALRRLAQLPPFTAFVQIQFSGEKEEQVLAALKDFIGRLKTVLLPYKNAIISVRAAEAAVKRIRNMQRYHILIHLRNTEKNMMDSIYRLVSSVTYQNVLTGIDLNPVNMV